MKGILRFLFCTVLLWSFHSEAQVVFSNSPSRLQLFPRASDDSASVALIGEVAVSQWTKIIFTFHKDNVLADSTVLNLNFIGNNSASFTKNYRIKAKKSWYNFRVYLYDNNSTVKVLTADSVVCGDVFLINGQSNATANALNGGTDAPYFWVRSFGNPTTTVATAQADTSWGLGVASPGGVAYSIGVWGIRLAKMLADSLNVPICVINGARPGTEIYNHLPSANPLNLSSYYGRLLYRAQKAKVDQSIKAIFWYQGESDGGVSDAPVYTDRFDQLRAAWLNHYTGYKKIFVIQTHPGCIDGLPQHSQVREELRSLSHIYNDVITMSSVGISGFDGCHFNVQGYQALAGNLYRQVTREFYGKSQPVTTDPPDIVSISFTNQSNTELSLVFSQPVSWPAPENGHILEDYFYFNNTLNVLSGVAVNNTIKLTLSASSNASLIDYLPNQYYNSTVENYDGPWLTNSDGLGAFSFYNFPIGNVLTIAGDHSSFCGTSVVKLTCNKSSQSFQWYYNGNPINGATTNKYNAGQPGQYFLRMTDANSITITSNTLVISAGSSVTPVITSPGGQLSFCDGGSLLLSTTIGATAYLWSTGQTTNGINVSTSGTYSVTVSDALGCTAVSAPVNITKNTAVIPTINSISTSFCNGDSLLLSASYGNSFLWSTGNTTQSIYAKSSASFTLTVTDANGCKATSMPLAITKNTAVIPSINSTSTSFCNGDSLLLSASYGNSFLWSTGNTTQSIYAKSSASFTLTVTDANGCMATSMPLAVTKNTALIPSINSTSTSFCNGDSLLLSASYGNSFLWSTGNTTQNIYTKNSGSFTLTVTDANGCKATSNQLIVTRNTPQTPSIVSSSNSFCPGGSWTLSASNAYLYLWSTGATTQSINTINDGIFTVTVTDSLGCKAASDPFTVAINTPVIPFIFSSRSTLCSGDSVLLLSSQGISYLWSNGSTTQSIYVNAPGTFTIMVTDSAGCIGTSNPLTITMGTGITPTILSSKTNFCDGDSILLTASTGNSFLWSTGATSPSIYTSVGGTFTVTVTDGVGCVGSSLPFVFTKLTSPTAIITSLQTQACQGTSIALSISGGTNYHWSTGQTTTTINVTQSGGYLVTVTNSSGCSRVSNPYQITFDPGPVVTISPLGAVVICSGMRQIITANAIGVVSYQWYKGTSMISGAITNIYSAGSSGNYSVRGTSSLGCTSTSAACMLTVASTPTASIIVSNQFDVCQDTLVTLTANIGTNFTYQWQKNSININGIQGQVYQTNSKGSYRVIVYNQSGCSKTSSAVAVPVTAVTATVTASGSKTFCNGDSVTFTANSGTGYSYQWQKSGANISGATMIKYVAKTSGSYRVRVANAMGCTATSSTSVVTVNTCLNRVATVYDHVKYTEVLNLYIYPNPSSAYFTIENTGSASEAVYFDIIDMSGRLLQSGKMDFSNGSYQLENSLPAGIYILRVDAEGLKKSYRLVKTGE